MGFGSFVKSAVGGLVGGPVGSFAGMMGGGGNVNVPGVGPAPKKPDFLSIRGKDDLLKDQFRIGNKSFKGEDQAGSAIDRLFGAATAEGPSDSAKYLLEQNELKSNDALGGSLRGNQSSFNEGLRNLAMRGGVNSGARERLAEESVRNASRIRQNNNQSRIGGELEILGNDEAQKTNLLSNLPQQSLGLSRFLADKEDKDISRAIGDVANQNSFNTSNFSELMKAHAGAASAAEMANSANNNKGILSKLSFGLL